MRRPAYYDKFKCIAGACTDSCCKGWEIDIDEATCSRYEAEKGPFGERLRRHLRPPVEYDDDYEPAHFELTEKRRCPFLNDRNLCDIILELGEDAISEVCTHHPRYYDWLTGVTEAGVGLACEEAAQLILTDEMPGKLVDDGSDGAGPGADEEAGSMDEGSESEELLLQLRENLIETVNPAGGRAKAGQVSDDLYGEAFAAQTAWDDYLYGEAEPEEERNQEAAEERWTQIFWNEDLTEAYALIDFYLGLDINTGEWREELLSLREQMGQVIAARADFRKAYPDAEGQYRRLLVYFLYRYLMRARYDGYLLERVIFALISVDMIEMMDIARWIRRGSFDLWDQICVCKLYSQEIEYDSDNVDLVSMYMTEETMQGSDSLPGI